MPRQLLSQEIIIKTSIELIEADKNNSFAAIARELGTKSQALYNYFPNQTALNYAIVAWTIKSTTDQLRQNFFGQAGLKAIANFAMAFRKVALDHFYLTQFVLKLPRSDNFPEVNAAFKELKTIFNQLIATVFTDPQKQLLASRCARDLTIGDIVNVGTGWFADKTIPADKSFRQILEQSLRRIAE
ncbi:TetR/AcrR family transcriptional regulator [Lactobacillus helsingborgensis]|uniref:TetR/AcrR family transcriptional regulator n=1 Tax=Lactobacillus helsingborgensis TaxID=1218494 RepID=UPI001CC35293|nr:TetR/AcrR family transcriptional regulator [Lactobacillus helsingborgensis]